MLHQRPQSLYPILPIDLFSLKGGSRAIGDGNFDDPKTQLRELRGHFRFDLESVRLQDQFVYSFASKYLVRRLHIGEPRVEEEVGRARQESIGDQSKFRHIILPQKSRSVNDGCFAG